MGEYGFGFDDLFRQDDGYIYSYREEGTYEYEDEDEEEEMSPELLQETREFHYAIRSIEHYMFDGKLKVNDPNLFLTFQEVADLYDAEKNGFVPNNDNVREHIHAMIKNGDVSIVDNPAPQNGRWK